MYIYPGMFPDPTPKEIYERKVRARMKKAKHLSDRITQFIFDLKKSDLKANDKKQIEQELMNWKTKSNHE